jgi:thioredoxin 2
MNRVDIERINGGAICAKCKRRLDFSRPVGVSSDQFEKVVLESGLPVLVDFWAPWCGPCRTLAPVLEEVAGRNEKSVVVVKVNTDESPDISARYGIRSIPTMILFSEGREVARRAGTVPAPIIEAMIEQARE